MIGFIERGYLRSQGLDDDDIDWLGSFIDGDGYHILATLKAVWPRLARNGRFVELLMKVIEHQKETQ